MKSCIHLALAIFFVTAYWDSFANADAEDEKSITVYDLPPTVAIQPRKYEMKNSLMASAGYIPTDSFNKGYSLTASYRRALSSYITWEAISFTHVINNETRLKTDIQNLGIQVTNVGLGGQLDYPRQIYMTGIHYSPLYSKSLLFNSRLTYHETSLFLGVGSLNFNKIGYKSMIAPGLATRIYINAKMALTGYFRDYFFQDGERGITGIIDFGLGFEYRFGGDSQASRNNQSDDSDDE